MARVLFIQRIMTENLGPMYLSAVARQTGDECRLWIGTNLENLMSEIRRFQPDMLAFSSTTGSHIWALETAAFIKRLIQTPIILGGPHATYYPEVLHQEPFEMICRGEGEIAFREILQRLKTTRNFEDIPNLWVKSGQRIIEQPPADLTADLDSLPAPDRELYYRYPFLRDNENKSFITSRGCPYDCAYCSISSLREFYKGKGPFVRFHSPERVIDEIRHIKSTYGLRTIIFQDDTFILDAARLEKLMVLMAREVRIPFVCHIRADLVDEEIARLLKEGGCHSVDFGVESGHELMRSNLLGKKITDAQIVRAAEILHRHHIRFRTTNMIGLPGETLEQAFSTVKLNQLIRTDYPSSSVYQPYPRTKLGDAVIADGLAGKDYSVDHIGSSFFRTSLIDSRYRNQMINLQKLFWPSVRYPSLMPLIKRLVNLPPNIIFEGIFLFFYGLNYMRSENVSLRRVIRLGWRTAGEFFFGNR